MKPRFKLFPRFHYTFRFIDLFYAIFSVPKREHYFRTLFQNNELYFLNSARAGLCLILKALSQDKALRIGIQPYNCDTAFQAIIKAGCIPVFIDINYNFTIDENDLYAKKDTIDALIVTHTFGISADFDKIRAILKDKFIIEDCAHAFLTVDGEHYCGTVGDASIYSMGYGKFPSIGHGGFVILNNINIIENFKDLYNNLSKPNIISEIKETINNCVYSFAFKPLMYGMITYPFFKKLDQKFDFIQKKSFLVTRGFKSNQNVLFNNVNNYIKINTIRKSKSIHFLSMLSQQPEYILKEGNNYYLIPLLYEDREKINTVLFNEGFESGLQFSKSIDVAIQYGYIKGSCPIAEKIANKIIVMPNVVYLSVEKMKYITELLNGYSENE